MARDGSDVPLVASPGAAVELPGAPGDADLPCQEGTPPAGAAGRVRRGLWGGGCLCAVGGACVWAAGRPGRGPLRSWVQGAAGLEGEVGRPSEEATRGLPGEEVDGGVASERLALVTAAKVDWMGATWVRGGDGENCEDACGRFELACYESEGSWPHQKADVSHIAEGLGLGCKDHVSAENTYDPFVAGPFCSFGPWKPPNVWADWRPRNVRSCKAAPPRATTRLCPCVQEIPPKGCQECSKDCWQTGSCCEAEEDGCSQDPMLDKQHPDYTWWGATVNWEWAGVVPDSKWMENVTSYEDLPVLWNATTDHVKPLRIKVLTYNLYWWNLFDKNGGSDGAAGKLVAESGSDTPYDLMAFQECENIGWVLGDAGLSDSYDHLEEFYSMCVAWRNETWRRLDSGHDAVATDGGWVRNNKWGDRSMSWVRLEHRERGDRVFFANHHGPLPINSGGEAGGLATAHNLLAAIKAHAEEGDVIIFMGDFNSDYRSATVKMVSTRLTLGYHGESFGGIDNIFANTGEASFSDRRNLGGAGSDHDALTATVVVPAGARAVPAPAAGPRKGAAAARRGHGGRGAARKATARNATASGREATARKAAAARQAVAARRGRDGLPDSRGLGQGKGGAGRAAVLAAPVGAVAVALWG